MIKSFLIWKMSMLYLLREWKQTIIVILGGCIGAILIGLSISFYYSLDRSGADYLENHYGNINWELTVKTESGLTVTDQIGSLNKVMGKAGTEILPVIKQDVKIKGGDKGIIVSDIQLISFDPAIASLIEPEQPLWFNRLKSNELIMDRKTAENAGFKMNQIAEVIRSDGGSIPFRIVIITDEKGLSGYRYGSNRGTIITSLESARRLFEYPEGEFNAFLVPGKQGEDVFPVVLDKSIYNIENVKATAEDQINDLKSSYGIIFILLAFIAILSGMLLLSQILVMQSKARAKQNGIFRAIGMTKNQIRSLFFTESLILTFIQSGLGTLAGVFGGIGLVKVYYIHFGRMLERISGLAIPIKPYWSWAVLGLAFGFVFAIQLFITLFASWKFGRQPIMELILGTSHKAVKLSTRKKRNIVIFLCFGFIMLHFYYAFTSRGKDLLQGPLFIWVDLIWILACASLVLLITTHISSIFKVFLILFEKLKMKDFSFFMASKYPAQDKKQTFIITFLFTLTIMVTTTTIIISLTQSQYNDVDKTTQTILGFGGQVAYESDEQKAEVMLQIDNDPRLRQSISNVVPMESYQINIEQGKIPNTFLQVTEKWASTNALKLIAKTNNYKSDRDAWMAVLKNETFIILDEKFMNNGSDNGFAKNIRSTYTLGQEITLPIFENKLRGEHDNWEAVLYRKFKIVGFSQSSIEKNVSNQFYNATFVNPKVFQDLRKYGFFSNEYPHKGYLLLDFDYKNIIVAQSVKDHLISGNASKAYLPYLENGINNYMSTQIINVFIGFMLFTALIAITGLLIVQIRAVQMRSGQIAMMRCIGISVKQIMYAFFFEGVLISSIGVIAGVLFGSTGGYMYVKVIQESAIAAHLELIPFVYPIKSVGLSILFVVICSLLINIFPAKRTAQVTPGYAMKISN